MQPTLIILLMLGTFFTGSLGARADSGNPFGFETNKHPLEYEYCKRREDKIREGFIIRSPYVYACSSAPRPHPDILGQYSLFFIEGIGLCRIRAKSFPSSGEKEKSLENFKLQIAKKYGPPTGESESTWGLDYFWRPEKGFNGLGDVEVIELSLSYDYVSITFDLVSMDRCQKKLDDDRYLAF